MNPRSTDYEADALTTTPSRRLNTFDHLFKFIYKIPPFLRFFVFNHPILPLRIQNYSFVIFVVLYLLLHDFIEWYVLGDAYRLVLVWLASYDRCCVGDYLYILELRFVVYQSNFYHHSYTYC